MDYENIVEKEEQEERKKKPRKWRSRIFIGLLIVLIATGSFFAGQAFLITGFSGGVINYKTMSKLMLIEACINKYFFGETDEEEIETQLYRGLMKGLNDQYADYYSKDEYKQLMDEDAGEYFGIGVTVRQDTATGYVIIDVVNKNGPAYGAGLQAGDIIMEVDGEDTSKLGLQDTVQAIKGKKEPCVLTIYREHEPLEITVEKSDIKLESVDWRMQEEGIGYVSIDQFVENTFSQFDQAVSELEEQGMKGLIIDLRDNGGGLLTSCIDMVSRLLPKGRLIVYTEDKEGNRMEYNSNSKEKLEMPIVILVNENTASASEIMTGCLKDYQLATVVGETTFGKGIVQNVIPLGDGSAIKMTISKYYTPKGNNIHEVGVSPDIEVKISGKKWMKVRSGEAKDKQLEKAVEVMRGKIK